MMGWSGGTHIADVMTHSIEGQVPLQHTRVKIYKDLIVALENADWDNLSECIGISDAFDEALKEHDPGWFDEEPDDIRRCPKCSRRYCTGDTNIFPDCCHPKWEP